MSHPVVFSLLARIPDVTVRRAPIVECGEYHHARRTILIRHGLRGARYFCTVVHEAVHAIRGDEPALCDERQEAAVRRDAARLMLPDIWWVAEAAATYPDDPHRVAEELDVDYDTLVTRVQHLHPSERHYLRRRLAHTEETA